MASRLAQALSVSAAANQERLFGGKARQFYLEICRCLPFIHRIHNAEEVVTLKELRSIVKHQFHAYKDVKDPRTYLMMHKQRHHLITEYVEPYYISHRNIAGPSGRSAFLDKFFDTAYPEITQKPL